MTASQVGEWIAYAELEPFGAVYETKLHGMICATVGNFSERRFKDEKTGKDKYWVPEDFVPNPLIERKPVVEKKQTPEEMALILRGAIGGKRRQRKK